MEDNVSIIPLEKLVSTETNMYELTNAVIQRSRQLSLTTGEEGLPAGTKIVSQAIREIILNEVQYNSKRS